MLKIVAYDILNGEAKEVVGIFESVQMTGKELRDPEGNLILTWMVDYWYNDKTGNLWHDWTVEVES